MIETVLNGIVSLLQAAGIDAMLQYPITPLDKKRGPVVCVAVKSGTQSGSGLGDYLGIRNDNGALRDLYGYRLHLTVSLDIFVPWSTESISDAMACFSAVSHALYALPSGLKPQKIYCGTAKPDKETEMLKYPAEMECIAVLICEKDMENGEFTDFVLKGVLKS